MPFSLKQLEQRYQKVCENLKDCREYTLQHLMTTIEIDVQVLHQNLPTTDLEECETTFETIEETIQQCRVAVRNEKSRRLLMEKIVKMAERDNQKTIQQHAFKLKKENHFSTKQR